jgi:SAM-dependent methyltransferase
MALEEAADAGEAARCADFGQVDRTSDPASFVLYLDAASATEFARTYKQRAFALLGVRAGDRILDVGCGTGGQLRRFLDYGADPANLYGLDLAKSRVEQAKTLAPAINWSVASASQLPFETASFDLILISVVLTSVLDEEVRKEISIELRRVLKPEGKILWFDFAFSNPRNRAVRGLNRTRVARLFPGAKIDLKRVCLAPPLARLIAPRAYWLAEGLERLAFLNTHLLGIISFESFESGEPA